MTIDHTKVIAFFGVAGYGPDNRTQPGRLGWGVGTDGYGPIVDRFLLPLVTKTGCRRIFMDRMWFSANETTLPLRGPMITREKLPAVYDSIEPAFRRIKAACTPAGSRPRLEVIQYHGSVTQFTTRPLSDEFVGQISDLLSGVLDLARQLGHSTAWDQMSALSPHHWILCAFLAMHHAGLKVYMEQRPRKDQTYLACLPTVTALTELVRQEERGGEPDLLPFSGHVENILLADRVPPDRDPLDGWDPWIVDQVEAWQADGFTPAVPIHSMVNRNRWDLLKLIFGEPA